MLSQCKTGWTSSCLEISLRRLVWTYDTFENNSEIKHAFPRSLKLSCLSGSYGHFPSNIFWRLLLLERYHQHSKVVYSAPDLKGLRHICPHLFRLAKSCFIIHSRKARLYSVVAWTPRWCSLSTRPLSRTVTGRCGCAPVSGPSTVMMCELWPSPRAAWYREVSSIFNSQVFLDKCKLDWRYDFKSCYSIQSSRSVNSLLFVPS